MGVWWCFVVVKEERGGRAQRPPSRGKTFRVCLFVHSWFGIRHPRADILVHAACFYPQVYGSALEVVFQTVVARDRI